LVLVSKKNDGVTMWRKMFDDTSVIFTGQASVIDVRTDTLAETAVAYVALITHTHTTIFTGHYPGLNGLVSPKAFKKIFRD